MHVSNSRRRVLAVTGAAATTTLAGCGDLARFVGSSGASKDWPSFAHNPANTGYTSETSGPQETPEVRWQIEVNGSITASPVVADGAVYASSFDGNLYALDAETGDEEWRFGTGDSLYGSPAVDNDRVFVGSTDGSLYAIGTDTGEEEWAYDTPNEGIVAASPAVVDDTVYCEFSGYVFALDAGSGDERWRTKTGSGLFFGPAVADGTVFSVPNRSLQAYDAKSGGKRWSISLSATWTWPVVAEGAVHLGGGDRLLAIGVASGDIRWEANHGKLVTTTPAAGPDGFYYGTMSRPPDQGTPSVLRGVNASGEQQWSLDLAGQAGAGTSLADDMLYVGTRPLEGATGAVHAIDAQTGERAWRLQTEGVIGGAPAIADGSVYVGTAGSNNEPGYVYAIE